MLKTGMVVDNRYRILREIGRGGTSCVYLAENIRLHNLWAIKEVYRSGLTEDGAKSDMLIAESSILTKLRHPGLPSIIDIMTTPQSYLIVMEYIEGISLDKVLRQSGACTESNVIKWGKQICDVLSYLHSQQPAIIYRDMKPANVMLKPDGNIVLIDFGMAREFKGFGQHDTTLLGTHGYAAPEQYDEHRQSDIRTDLYGLGVTLYHLLTGHDPCLPPYGINSVRVHNPSLSSTWDAVIKKCTKLDPEERYQMAQELNNALDTVSRGSNPMVAHNESPKKKRSGWLWLLALIPVLIIVIIVGVVAGVKKTTDNYLDFMDNIGKLFSNDTDNVAVSFEQYVYIAKPNVREYYTFSPEKTGYYEIYSISEKEAPVIWLTNENDILIAKDNTTGEYNDFFVKCWLTEGKEYYIETTLYDQDPSIPSTGSFWIYVDYVE